MPALYAHYRFGAEVLKGMPADVRKPVQRFRRLYDVGLHGPDLFFYYNPLMQKGAISRMGHDLHYQTGQVFFQRVCRGLRLDPNEGAQAYLYGLLAHYCLDSICHPFINEKDATGEAGHTVLEAEFERFLLEKDGKPDPHAFDGTRHLKLTPGEYETVARFYPPVTGSNIRTCLSNMRFATKVMNLPEGVARKGVCAAAGKMGESIRGMVMPTVANPACAYLDAPLFELYRQAVETYPVMLEQICAHLMYNAPLGSEFDGIFG